MLQIRKNVFETNSLSAHSFTLLNNSDFQFRDESAEEILKIKVDKENNLLVNVYSNSKMNYEFIGVNEKLLFLIVALGKDYYFEHNSSNWKIEELDWFKEVNDLAIKKGYNGVKILADDKEFFNPYFILDNNIIDDDIEIENIAQLEEIYQIDIESIIFDNKIVIHGFADRDLVYEDLPKTIKEYKELKNEETIIKI